MGYRDEKASLRARVAELETELAKKDQAIARLEGRLGTDGPADPSHSKLLDAPLAVTLERTLDHGVSNEGLEAIGKVLRERLRLEVSQIGRTLRGKELGVGFELSMVDGRTEIRLEARYRDRRNGFFIGGPVFALIACGAAVAALSPLGVAPMAMAGALVLVSGLSSLGLLMLIRGVVKGEQANVVGSYEAVLALAEEHAEKADEAIRARVATEEEPHTVPAKDAEAEARG